MKKISAILAFSFILFAVPLHADDVDGRTSMGAVERIGYVIKRGVINALTFPWEMVRTPKVEKELHPKLWPATAPFRTVANMVLRASSSVHDMALFPLYLPLTNDISPWTEGFDLPEYPWED
jgi:hypothetical protein